MKLALLISLMCLDTIKTLPLPEGWEKKPAPATYSGSTFTTFTTFTDDLSFTTSDSGWLIIHPGDTEPRWAPAAVLIESKHQPSITKINDRWVIRFKKMQP